MRQNLIISFLIIGITSCSSSRYLMERYGVREIRLRHDGRERSCLIHVPQKNSSGRMPLLLVLHGGGGDARRMLKLTRERFNELSDAPAIQDLPDSNPDDGTKGKKISYGPCSGDTRVILYSIEGGGHTWPGGIQYLPKQIVGNTSREINAGDLIWDFFSSAR